MPSNLNEQAIMDKFDDKIKKIEEQLLKISDNFLNSQKNKDKIFQKRIKKELDNKMKDIDNKLLSFKEELAKMINEKNQRLETDKKIEEELDGKLKKLDNTIFKLFEEYTEKLNQKEKRDKEEREKAAGTKNEENKIPEKIKEKNFDDELDNILNAIKNKFEKPVVDNKNDDLKITEEDENIENFDTVEPLPENIENIGKNMNEEKNENLESIPFITEETDKTELIPLNDEILQELEDYKIVEEEEKNMLNEEFNKLESEKKGIQEMKPVDSQEKKDELNKKVLLNNFPPFDINELENFEKNQTKTVIAPDSSETLKAEAIKKKTGKERRKRQRIITRTIKGKKVDVFL